jgi:E1A/CREB-binding protein
MTSNTNNQMDLNVPPSNNGQPAPQATSNNMPQNPSIQTTPQANSNQSNPTAPVGSLQGPPNPLMVPTAPPQLSMRTQPLPQGLGQSNQPNQQQQQMQSQTNTQQQQMQSQTNTQQQHMQMQNPQQQVGIQPMNNQQAPLQQQMNMMRATSPPQMNQQQPQMNQLNNQQQPQMNQLNNQQQSQMNQFNSQQQQPQMNQLNNQQQGLNNQQSLQQPQMTSMQSVNQQMGMQPQPLLQQQIQQQKPMESHPGTSASPQPGGQGGGVLPAPSQLAPTNGGGSSFDSNVNAPPMSQGGVQQQQPLQQQPQQPGSQPTMTTSGPPAVASSSTSATAGTSSGSQQSRPPPPSWYIQEQHIIDRRKMVTSIAKLLQQRKPNAPTEWMKKLPQMARRLEESLFREAVSFEEYKNQDTLKKRLQKLALDMGIRAKASQAASSNGQPPNTSSNQPSVNGGATGGGGDGGGGSNQPQPSQSASQQTPEQRQQVLRQQQQRLLLLRHASKCPHGENGVAVNESNHSEGARVVRGKDWKWGDQDGGNSNIGILGKKRANGWTAVTWEKTRAEREYRIGGEDSFDLQFGGCPVTQHCAGMRTLWKHIAECKDQQCQTPHCVSSRYVLSHYHRCRERSCAVCQPVREAIQRNHEKAKELEASRNQKQTGTKSSSGGANGTGGGGGKSKKSKTNNDNSNMGSNNGGNATKRPKPSKGKKGNVNNDSSQSLVETPLHHNNNQAVVALPHKPVVKKAPDPTTSMIYSFSTCQIKNHINALAKPVNLKPTAIKAKCAPVLKKLMDAEFGWIFAKPVDPVQLNLPDYFEVIKKPMDLGTCKKKLENGNYRDINEFTEDIKLCFDNAITYNGPNSEVTEVAKKLRKLFDFEWKRVQQEMAKDEEKEKSNGDMCALCSRGSLQYEPTSYYCNGNGCNGAKIRRNSYYYCDSRNKYHCCPTCYNDLPSSIEMADTNLEKNELSKKKNDEQFEEPWVGCDGCSRWVHQICALFNGRKNNLETTVYFCPFCVLSDRAKLKVTDGTVKYKGASEIPHTRASCYIERRVRNKIAKEQRRILTEEGIDVKDVPRPGKLHVRQLSNLKDKCHQVRPRVYERYKDQGFPMEFPVTSKCIVLFEEIEGVDVILFGMYLYEYGHKCPQPNHRRVYVSYLDSVHYFHPRQYRTMVYHEMLVAYLAYAKARGFHTCHIWSCPPFKGDDYIFFCHPEEQKTPKDDRLRAWYMSMLNKCEQEGTVVKLTTLYDEGFSAPDSKVINVPYFEGDHWILEAEAILKSIEDEKESRLNGRDHDKNGDKDQISKTKKSKNKSAKDKKGKRGLRSDGDVEELNGRDPLLVRMGKTLEPMKDAFIVAHLHSREFAAEKWQQRLLEIEAEEKEDAEAAAGGGDKKDVKNEEANMDATAISSQGVGSGGEKTAPQTTSSSSSENNGAVEGGEGGGGKEEATVKSEVKTEDAPPAPPSSSSTEPPVAPTAVTEGAPTPAADNTSQPPEPPCSSSSAMDVDEKPEVKTEEGAPKTESSSETPVAPTTSSSSDSGTATTSEGVDSGSSSSSSVVKSEGEVEGGGGGGESQEVKKEDVKDEMDIDKKAAEEEKDPFPDTTDEEYPPFDPPKDETEDQDEQMESEFFDTRQQFLNLCQGNHYQFDQVRRAKHTSMMALYHIHNPDKPKFLTPCSHCGVDINSGFQYDCEQCPEFHLCHKCLMNFQMEHKSPHIHRLKKVVVQSESGQLTEEQKKQRKRSIELHMQLLAHASTCKNAECPSANCEKMKNLLAHGTKCTVKIQGGCSVCRRIWALLQIHARQCRRSNCQVPKCRQLKEQLRNIELQQAAMDERRRLAMNEQYSQRPAAEESK